MNFMLICLWVLQLQSQFQSQSQSQSQPQLELQFQGQGQSQSQSQRQVQAQCKLKVCDYVNYQRTFTRIDEDLSVGNFNLAVQRLDTIYENFDFIYARHCIKALQICVMANDSVQANKWLYKCSKQGVPFWILRANKLTKKALLFSTTKLAIAKYDSLYSTYKSSINHEAAQKIDSLLEIDQKYTYKVNNGFFPFRYTIYFWQWKRNNRRQYAMIGKLTNTYGYPGERLIGLPRYLEDSLVAKKGIAFYGPYLQDSRVETMLVHYLSSQRPDMDIDMKLHKYVEAGYLPAEQFASFADFLARWGRRKYRNSYYSVWHYDPDPKHLEEINDRRRAIGLTTFERQLDNILIKRERRKKGVADAEVILE